MKKALIILLLGIAFLSPACEKNDDAAQNSDLKVIISPNLYDNAPSSNFTINSLEIVQDYLKINFSSSGCDGSSWELKLIDSGSLMFSNPPQRYLRFVLNNNELCQAYIDKELMFDISDLKIDNEKILLNIENSSEPILYE